MVDVKGMKGQEDVILSMVERFRLGFPLDRKRLNKILDFFKYLSGGDSPLEAVQLTLLRNQKLREAQLKTVCEIEKMVENPPDTLKNGYPNSKAGVNVLFSSNLLNLLFRVLKIRLPDDCMATEEEHWSAIYYHCMVILKNVLGFNHYAQLHLKEIMENETVEDLLEFCDDSIDTFACFPAVSTLKNMCLQNRETCERIIFSNGLPKIAYLVMKDNAQKMVIKAFKNGLKPYQKNILHTNMMAAALECRSRKTELSHANIAGTWSYKMQMDAAVIILKTAEQNDRCRRIVIKDRTTFKAVMKWTKSPAITANDCSMMEVCTKIIGLLCLNEGICWQMIDSYDIITHVENGISVPIWTALSGYLDIALRISAQGGRCRNRLLESEHILSMLAKYMFSYNKELQDTCLRILANLAESGHFAEKLIHCGVTPKSIFILGSFYQSSTNTQAELLSKILCRNSHREWKREEAAFDKERCDVQSRSGEEKAQHLKVKGNETFKLGSYSEAARFYSEALQCVPPGLEASKAGKDGSRWWSLPAVLFSNRAQCHLNNGDWGNAVSDCHDAVARCIQVGDDAKKIMIKAVFRRAKAFMELGEYYRALNDISCCLRNKFSGGNVQTQYWEILMKYRSQYGLEPIRRCGNCMGGEGDRLKRCADCDETYCSRKCQAEAWEKGHKNYCKLRTSN